MTLKSYERPKGRVKPDTGIGSDSPHVTVARHDDGSSTITEHANLAAAKAHIDSHNKSNPSTPIMAWPKKEADRLSKDANTAKAFGFNNPSKEPRKHADDVIVTGMHKNAKGQQHVDSKPHVTIEHHPDGKKVINDHPNRAAAKEYADAIRTTQGLRVTALSKEYAQKHGHDTRPAGSSKEAKAHAESKSSDIKKWASSKTGGDSGGGYSHWKGGSK